MAGTVTEEALLRIAFDLDSIQGSAMTLGEAWGIPSGSRYWDTTPDGVLDLANLLHPDFEALNLTLAGSQPDGSLVAGGFVGVGVKDGLLNVAAALANDPTAGAVHFQGLYDQVLTFAKGVGPGVGEHIVEDAQGKVWRWIQEQLQVGPGSPETVLTRAAGASAFCMGMGLLAHGISTVLSFDFLGCGDFNATGVAALLSDFAGFGSLVSSLQGPFYRAFIGTPWTYHVNGLLRPNIPGVGDLCRFRGKRLFGNEAWSEQGPDLFKDNMRYHGLSDTWIDFYEADLYEEPAYRVLMQMLSDPAAADDDKWLREKALTLGYDDHDALLLMGGLKHSVVEYYDNRLIALWLQRVQAGELDLGEFADLIDSIALPRAARSRLLDLAGETWHFAYIKESITAAQEAYARDELTDREFADTLDALGLRKQQIDHLMRRARLGRLHKVYVTRPVDEALKSGGIYRTAFISGLITEDLYTSVLEDAHYEPAVVAMRLEVDGAARDRAIVAHLREYRLPAYRDDLMAGRISLAQYRAALEALGFPDAILPDEMAWAAALQERARIGRVERYMIPTAEQAYTRALISRAALVTVYREAGRLANEIALRLVLLNELRVKCLRDEARGKESAPTDAQLLAWQEWQYINGKVSQADLVALYLKLGKPPDYVARRLKVLAPMRL